MPDNKAVYTVPDDKAVYIVPDDTVYAVPDDKVTWPGNLGCSTKDSWPTAPGLVQSVIVS